MALLEIREISVRYGDLNVVDRVSFSLEENQWLMIIGPNGAGKSTLISAISQYAPYSGSVFYRGRDMKRYHPRERARDLGVLAQKHSVGYDFTVEEVVRLGRYAHSTGVFSGQGKEDERHVGKALELTGLTSLAKHSVLTLSGGELQRTFLAQTLAQDPKVLILDEPTNHLDLVHQKQLFGLVREWLKQEGRAAVSVVHDLSLARAYGTHALLMHRGKVLAQGCIEEVFTREHLRQAYSMDVNAWMREMLEQWEG